MPENTSENTPVSSKDYSVVGAAIFEMIAAYMAEHHPDVHCDYQSIDGPGHLGLVTTPGGKYLTRDVIGGYTAQLPFQIVYQTPATTNALLLAAEAVIEDLSGYLEELAADELPGLDGDRVIDVIVMDGVTYRSSAESDASVIFSRAGKVNYSK